MTSVLKTSENILGEMCTMQKAGKRTNWPPARLTNTKCSKSENQTKCKPMNFYK